MTADSCHELLERLHALRFYVQADGDQLRYEAPSSAMTTELLQEIRRHKADLIACLTNDSPSHSTTRAPVTSQQAWMIRAHMRQPCPQVLNVALRITMRGHVDLTSLETALSEIVARHHALRCRFVNSGGTWCQEVLAPGAVQIMITDMTRVASADKCLQLSQITQATVNTPFDLSLALIPRFRLVRLHEDFWVLIFVLHHISCDGWSVSLLLQELADLYRWALGKASGKPSAPRTQCTDYAWWQQATENRSARVQKMAFWQNYLRDAPFHMALPTDFPRPECVTGRGHTVRTRFPGHIRSAVEDFARSQNVTPFCVTIGAFAALLAALSGDKDLLLMVAYANRERHEFESMVTCTMMGMALRFRMDSTATFADLVGETAVGMVNAVDNLIPVDDVINGLKEVGQPAPARFPIGLTYQNSLELDVELPDLKIHVEDMAPPAARAELIAGLVPCRDPRQGYRTWAEFTTDLWRPETIKSWLRSYSATLLVACREPGIHLSKLTELAAIPAPPRPAGVPATNGNSPHA